MRFRDREDAGRQLADRLADQALTSPLVLALPRGGVPVAAPVAAALDAALVPFVARKVGAPGHPEYGIGAIAEGSDEVLSTSAVDELGISAQQMQSLADAERGELHRRVHRYRGSDDLPDVRDRDVVLVDDGVATGVTAEAALRSLRDMGPRRLILAIPVCARDTAQRLSDIADTVVCIRCPQDFRAVGHWYKRFEQLTDDDVLDTLQTTERGASG